MELAGKFQPDRFLKSSLLYSSIDVKRLTAYVHKENDRKDCFWASAPFLFHFYLFPFSVSSLWYYALYLKLFRPRGTISHLKLLFFMKTWDILNATYLFPLLHN